jgi:hypothetical protein
MRSAALSQSHRSQQHHISNSIEIIWSSGKFGAVADYRLFDDQHTHSVRQRMHSKRHQTRKSKASKRGTAKVVIMRVKMTSMTGAEGHHRPSANEQSELQKSSQGNSRKASACFNVVFSSNACLHLLASDCQ